jgi:hypothetical protein
MHASASICQLGSDLLVHHEASSLTERGKYRYVTLL